LTGTASAQGNPAILAAIHTVEDGVIGLQNSMNTLQTSVDSLVTAGQSNARFTPTVNISSSSDMNCQLVNISSATRTVRLQTISGGNGSIVSDTLIPLAAGHSIANNSTSVSFGFTFYCKFMVVDGSRTDVRASIVVFNNTAPGGVRFSLPAE